jgi:hypothetical protein
LSALSDSRLKAATVLATYFRKKSNYTRWREGYIVGDKANAKDKKNVEVEINKVRIKIDQTRYSYPSTKHDMGNTKVKRSRCPIKALFVAKHAVKYWYCTYGIKRGPITKLRRLGTGAISPTKLYRINVTCAHLHDPTG